MIIGCFSNCSTNFGNMKKLKLQFFLSANSTSNHELDTKTSDLRNVRNVRK